MEYTQLGETSLYVSKISYGTWQFGGDRGSFDAREAQAAIRHALELGITFFDTAQAYGFGVSERVLGEALQPELKNRRDKIILATKGGLRMEGNKLLRDASAKWLRQGVEQSLRNLGVDASTFEERSSLGPHQIGPARSSKGRNILRFWDTSLKKA